MHTMTREEKWILDEKYGGLKNESFLTDCQKLEAGEPLAYIIGSIPFLNTTIYLDSKPLIPRPETEFWVEKVIQEIIKTSSKLRDRNPKLHILDLCAGSGCIGVAVLKAIPNAFITFTEIDITHRTTIIKNCEFNGISKDRYTVTTGDLFNPVSKRNGTFDYILSNPPYIDEEAQTVEKSVRDNEPSIALFGGTDGFEIIKRIIQSARPYLKPNGVLYIEHEPSQTELLQKTATLENFSSFIYTDQYAIERYSALCIV